MSDVLPSVVRIAEDYPTQGRPTYGLQPNFYYLSREQARMGLKVSVVARRHRGQPTREEHEGVQVYRVDSPFNLNSLSMVRRLAESERNSVIHTHSTMGIGAAVLKRTIHAPIFSHVHGTSRSAFMPSAMGFEGIAQPYSKSKLWYYYFRERYLWSRATRVLAVSGSVKKDLEEYYGILPDKVDVVYNGVDANLFRRVETADLPGLDAVKGRPIVLYVGHFGPRKGIAYLIMAMERVKMEVPDAALVCIGGVPDWLPRADYWSALRGLITRRGLGKDIVLLDRVPNDKLPAYYSRAQVFALPSYYEAFAKVVLEAMSCEVPVVVSTEGGPAEAIRDGENGFLFRYGKVDEISHAITRLLVDPAKARRMGTAARRLVEDQFTWERVGARILHSYRLGLSGAQEPTFSADSRASPRLMTGAG